MMSAAVTAPARQAGRMPAVSRIWRIGVALGVAVLCVLLALSHVRIRGWEARLSGMTLEAFGYDLYTLGDMVIFHTIEGSVAFQISIECTILVIAIPLLVFASAVLVITRVSLARWLLAVVAGLAIVTVTNLIRLAIISTATLEWGDVAYGVTHTVIGTIVIAIGTIAAVLVMLRVMNTKHRSSKSQSPKTVKVWNRAPIDQGD